MNKSKKLFYGTVAGVAALSMMLTGISAFAAAEEADTSQGIISVAQIDMESAKEIIISNGEISGIDPEETGDDISFDGSTLSINKAGTYILSGELEGTIKVSGSKKEEIILVLNGLTVTNESEAALSVKKAAKLTILLNDRTENVFTSGTETEINEDSAAAAADKAGAAIELKSDTVITGTGKLIVNGYVNNGVTASGSLTVEAGNIVVNAVNNGIKVKEDLVLGGGNIETLTGGDGIKAEKEAVEAADAVIDESTGEVITEAVEAEEASGTITVNGSCINIDSYGDAIAAMLDLTVNSGEITIKTEGEYNTAESRGESPGGQNGTAAETTSEKGLKSNGTININGGTITIDSKDDAVHAADNMLIAGGELTLSSGDDGLHSDVRIDINDGSVEILDSYEGIEANQIYVNGGTVRLKASDDGFNASGGSDSFGGSQGQAADQTASKDTPNLFITGGEVYVNADGDGLDSNGNLIIQGGYTIVDGPTDSMNGALDSGSENGGTITVSGGTIIAVGASGMAESFESSSSQCSIKLILNSYFAAGTEVKVSDMSGTAIFSYNTAKTGNCIVYSSPELKQDETFTITVGTVDYQIPITSISTTVTGADDGTITEGSNGNSGGGQRGDSNKDTNKTQEAAAPGDGNGEGQAPADGERPTREAGENPGGGPQGNAPNQGDSQQGNAPNQGDSQPGDSANQGDSQQNEAANQGNAEQPEETKVQETADTQA